MVSSERFLGVRGDRWGGVQVDWCLARTRSKPVQGGVRIIKSCHHRHVVNVLDVLNVVVEMGGRRRSKCGQF